MSPDNALMLLATLLRTTVAVCGPVLAAALIGGLCVGVVQTATQINEQSVGYVVKTAVVLLTMLVVGPYMAQKTVTYARETFTLIGQVVR